MGLTGSEHVPAVFQAGYYDTLLTTEEKRDAPSKSATSGVHGTGMTMAP